MPILTATITALGLYGGPAPANESYNGKAPVADSPRSYTQDFTYLAAYGGPMGPDGSFTGKVEQTTYSKSASDTVRAYVRESDVNNIDVESSDLLVPLVVDAYSTAAFKTASDSVVVRITDSNVALLKSSFIKTASDTAAPVLTDSGSVRVVITSSDSVVAVITDASVTIGKANAKTASDSVIPVIADAFSLNQLDASFAVSASDTARVFVFETTDADNLGEVDRITIVPKIGSIRITRV